MQSNDKPHDDYAAFAEPMSVRSQRIVMSIGSFSALCEMTRAEFLRIPWCGRKSLYEVEEELKKIGRGFHDGVSLENKKHGGGRPPTPDQAMSQPVGLRLPVELLEKIDQAAEANQWSRVEEIRRRLAASFGIGVVERTPEGETVIQLLTEIRDVLMMRGS